MPNILTYSDRLILKAAGKGGGTGSCSAKGGGTGSSKGTKKEFGEMPRNLF